VLRARNKSNSAKDWKRVSRQKVKEEARHRRERWRSLSNGYEKRERLRTCGESRENDGTKGELEVGEVDGTYMWISLMMIPMQLRY
jgi:hypothetical protein